MNLYLSSYQLGNEIEKFKELFNIYIKTIIDIEGKSVLQDAIVTLISKNYS